MKAILIFLSLFSTAYGQIILAGGGKAIIGAAAPAATPDTIAVNFTNASFPTGISGWNDVTITSGSSPSLSNLTYLDGTNSGASVSLDFIQTVSSGQIFDCSGLGGNTTGFPDVCGRVVGNRPSSSSGTPLSITMTWGSVSSGTYKLVVFAHRRAVANNELVVTSQSQSDNIANANDNCSDVAQISGLVPSSGNIIAVLTNPEASEFIYLCAAYLIRTGD